MSVHAFKGNEGIPSNFRGLLKGGNLVHHDAFDAAINRTRLTISANSIGVLDGEPGSGKSTAAQMAARSLGFPTVYLTMPANPSQSHLLRELAGEWVGKKFANGARQGELQEALKDRLVSEPLLLIIDEAQLLKRRGLSILQYLHDAAGWSFPMLLVGYQVKRLLETELDTLDSRVGFTTYFQRLSGERLYEYLDALDTRLSQTDRLVLQHLNDRYAGGCLRNWGHIVATLDASKIQIPLTISIANALLNVIIGDKAA